MIFMINTTNIIRFFLSGLFFLTLAFPFYSFAAGVSGELERSASTSPKEKLEYASDSNSEMRDAVKTVSRMLESAKRDSNVERLQCLNSRLTSIRALVQVSEAAEMAMRGALSKGQQERADHEFRKIAVALTKSRQLLAEAERCTADNGSVSGFGSIRLGIEDRECLAGQFKCDDDSCKDSEQECNGDLEIQDFGMGIDPPALEINVSIATKGGKEQKVKENSNIPLSFTVSLNPAATS